MAKDKFSWAKDYKKMGLSVFDETELKSLEAIRRRYAGSYKVFFQKMYDQYKKQPKKVKALDGVTEQIDKVINSIDFLLSSGQVNEPEKLTNELFESMAKVDGALMYFTDPKNQLSKQLKNKLSATEAETGETVKDLSASSRIMFERTKSFKKGRGIRGGIKEYAPSLYKGVTDMGKGLAYAALGPFAGLAQAGFEAYGGYKERKSQRDVALGQREFAGATLTKGQKTPKNIQDTMRHLYGGGIGRIPNTVKSGSFATKATENISSSARSPGVVAGSEGGMETGSRSVGVQSLETFFEGPALRIPYTARLLKAIEQIAGIKGDIGGETKKKGGLGGIFDGIKNFFGKGGTLGLAISSIGGALASFGTMIGTAVAAMAPFVLGIAAAAAAGWALGKLINKIPGVSKFISGNISKSGGLMGANIETGLEGQDVGGKGTLTNTGEADFYDPVTELRKRYLQENPGMDPKEAQRMAIEQTKTTAKIRAGVSTEIKDVYPDAVRGSSGFVETTLPPADIPIDTSLSNAASNQQKSLNGLAATLEKMKETFMTPVKEGSEKAPSGFDAFGTRDPWVSPLGSGILDIN